MTDDRILLGMHRPTWGDVNGKTCPGCGRHPYFTVESRDCWLSGHYDTPVYATRQEVLEAMAGKTEKLMDADDEDEQRIIGMSEMVAKGWLRRFVYECRGACDNNCVHPGMTDAMKSWDKLGGSL